ncbi:hypothetical protein LXN10_00980 [Arcobacter sp. KX21116]|uniref:HNH endonuclease n=1 Tax=Arcobacter iocasae TaxID=2906515 RepID=UPI0035D3F05D
MGVELKTHKMLWGRSGNRCAMPDCRIELVMDISETDDDSLIGEECHIVARKPKGPRGDKDFDKEKLDKYNNLVLMCRNHHKIIDDNPEAYTVEKLHQIKHNHEVWIRSQLSFDTEKQKDDELYATYIDQWVKCIDLDNWKNWTSYLLSADDPSITVEKFNKLDELREWLFSRIWSNRYTELENAFENFRLILQDFLNLFKEHMKKADEWYCTEKFYKLKWHEQDVYDRLSKQYTFHVLLVEDLVVELTRATNYICQLVRKHVDSSFRLKEGLSIIEMGPFMDMSWKQYRVQYTKDDLTKKFLYKNLKTFKEDRITRDYCRSVGVDENDKRFLEHYYS